MISNDYDISMSAQSKLNKNFYLIAHNIDGIKEYERE